MSGRKSHVCVGEKPRIMIKSILSAVGVLICFVSGLNYCNQILIKKDSIKQYDSFICSDQGFDVLFFGSSHVYNGISPLHLFHDYGITSYNLAMPANYIASNCYFINEILNLIQKQGKQLPEVVVVDIFPGQEEKFSLHRRWDDFAISQNKIDMSSDLVAKKHRADMLFPFFLYHNRWNELTKDDFLPEINKLYGCKELYGVSYPETEIITDSMDILQIEPDTAVYLKRMQDDCIARGVKLIFIHLPYSYLPDSQREANGILQFAERQGIYCINYMNEDIEIDYDIDFADAGHLNSAGMKIMTQQIGQLLITEGLKDHRKEVQAEQWEQIFEKYMQSRLLEISEINEAKEFLMSINDPDLYSMLQIRDKVMEDKQIAKLIDRLRTGGNQIVLLDDQTELICGGGGIMTFIAKFIEGKI